MVAGVDKEHGGLRAKQPEWPGSLGIRTEINGNLKGIGYHLSGNKLIISGNRRKHSIIASIE